MSCTEIRVSIIGDASSLASVIKDLDSTLESVTSIKSEIEALKTEITALKTEAQNSATSAKESAASASSSASKASTNAALTLEHLNTIEGLKVDATSAANTASLMAIKVENIYKAPLPIEILKDSVQVGLGVSKLDFKGASVSIVKDSDSYVITIGS